MRPGVALLLGSVAVYALLPLAIALLPERFRFLLLYTHVAGVLVLGGLLGAVYVLPVTDDVSLLAGQVSYGGFMLAAMVTVIVGHDVRVLRNVIALVVGVNALVYAIFAISRRALESAGVPNPFATSPEVFDQSLRVVVSGGALILSELVLMVAVLEVAKRRLGRAAMAPVYVLAYVGVLVLDGVLFPTLVTLPSEGLGEFIRSGVEAKLVLAGLFAVPLAAFVTLHRPALTRFEDTPLDLRDLVTLTHAQLLRDLDRQQAELEDERRRLLSSERHAGRVSATVEGIFGATTTTLLIATDAELRITHVNPGATAILGFPEADLLGRTPVSLLDLERLAAQEGAASPLDLVRAYAGSGERRDRSVRARDGSPRVLSIGVSAIRVGDEVVGYLFAGEDVTARTRAEEAYAEAARREHEAMVRLQEVDRLKQDLVTTVGHELRTPLTSISGSGQLLLEDDTLGSEHRRGVERILRSADRLGRLVDDLTALSGMDHTVAVEPVELDLREVTAGPVDLLGELARGRELTLTVHVPDSPVPCRGDRAALERVVAHLLSNAIKFTRAGGEVHLRVRGGAGSAELEVEDTGIGVADEDRDRIFERFARGADIETHAVQGAGLGLSLVAEVTAAHGGTVALDSTQGRGTRVTVRLPAAQ